ncbi:biotin/lipoyl-binding protein [Acidovorax sp. CCYZU-2555]|uniref:HlyD family secretion protein n=1 Tax=Acidovorax sp. CCYZU-2555 TaxID=2835042 RepID=UPI001BCE771C|nr:biotin/lipoyl-binding protein [Acidovorax sp. CCYZU-2555]MBS7781235.1 biotin/lipoyl-binding protein [Acidovorax sp. CCYZU-2555]
MLFRPEAIENASASWIAGVRASNALPTWSGVAIAVTLAASLVGYGAIGSYARKARVGGMLVPQGGELHVAAPSLGRITNIRIREGMEVRAGEVLMVLDTDRTIESGEGTRGVTSIIGEQIENRRQTLSAQQHALQNNARMQQQAIASRLRSLELEIQKFEDEVILQQQRRGMAALTLNQYEKLAADHFVSSSQVRLYQEALIDQDARLRSLERSRVSARKDRDASVMEQRQVETQLATDSAVIARDMANLDQEDTENRLRRYVAITAAHSGTVSALAVRPGQSVAAGQSLATIQPAATSLEAQLYAPSRTVGFVKKGQPVLVRFAAFPYQKFGVHHGEVCAISGSTFTQNELPTSLQPLFSQQTPPEALYRISVCLHAQAMTAFGQTHALRPGMLIEADIVQERRSIFEWLFEPLYAFARRA